MKISSSYGARLNGNSWRIFTPTVKIFRNAVKFLIIPCLEHYDDCIKGFNPNEAQLNIDHLIHSGGRRVKHAASYPSFDRKFYKMPNAMRRAAIDKAIAIVKSYKELYALWEEKESNGKPPRLNYNQLAMPCLFNRDEFKNLGSNRCSIKLYVNNDWVWVNFSLNTSDMKYIKAHAKNLRLSAPVLEKRYHHYYVRFTYEETVDIPVCSVTEEPDTEPADIICAVDLGINTDAVCSIMRPDGTVIGRKFINAPVEKDRMYRILGQIKRSQSRDGNYSHRKLWRFVNYYNEQTSIHTASEIVAFAASFNARVIVLEHLDINGKKKGSKKQRLHLWRKKDVLNRVTELAHKKKMRIRTVCAWNTSKLAYDGSGEVRRGSDAGFNTYSICRFSNGKIYNCDLSASYNIGARYFIKEFFKSFSETERQLYTAKVPDIAKRTLCTLSTLISLYAELSVPGAA